MSEVPTAELVMERVFDAPVDTIWDLWTNAEHFRRWYGPDGVVIPEATIDATVGGRRLVCMEMDTPGGAMRMWFGGEHLEVTRPTRLVYTEAMCDEHGVPTPADQLPPGHGGVTEVRVELEDLDGRTRLVLTHVGIPADSPGATGWTMALAKLAASLGG